MEKVGKCPDGKVPSLIPANYEIWSLFQLMLPGLIRQGGYDYNAVMVVFEVQGVCLEDRPKLLSQVVKLIDVIEAERRERAK